jgi:hypothetical protein
MSVRNALALLVATSGLVFLSACGGSSGSRVNPIAPPSGGFSASNLNGTYVFSVIGTDFNNGSFLQMVGTFNANGGGSISGGTVDFNDSAFTEAAVNLPVSGGSYSVTVDGRGLVNLNVSTPLASKVTLDFVLQNSAHGVVTEFDGNGTGSGTLDVQTAGVTPAGTYVFSFSGIDAAGSPMVNTGAFTLGSGGTISAGVVDFNDNNLVFLNEALSGTVTLGPSSTPSTQLVSSSFATQTFDVFPIDANHLKFIETDPVTAAPMVSGDAFSETSTTFPTGTLAFTNLGFFAGVPTGIGGFMVTDGAGNITSASSEDVNNDGAPSTAVINFSGTYSASGSLVPERYVLTLPGPFYGGSQYVAYPFTGGLLLMETDQVGTMSGAAFGPQTSTTFSASQGYGLNFTGVNLSAGAEIDDIAEFTANSSGATVSGVVDENSSTSGPNFDLALSGSYALPDATGRGSIAANAGNNNTSTLNGGFGLTFYTVDGTTFPFIETDSNGQVASGVFFVQSATGTSPGLARSNAFVARPLIQAHAVKQTRK